MPVERSFKSFCNKLGGSFDKQETDYTTTYFCRLENPVKVDGILFGRKADQGKYKVFLVHFGRKKSLELSDKDVSKFEVRLEEIEPYFVQGTFTQDDQYITYTTKEDIEIYGVEMGCSKQTNECKLSFII